MLSDLLHFMNEHSYMLLVAFALISLAIFLIARHVPNGALIWIGAAIIAVVLWFATRTGSGVQYTSVDQYEATISSGQATLVEFYSDYWLACLAAKPIVDGLKQQWRTGQLIRVDILTPIGREFADRHNFEGTPTFMLFDGAGHEVKRWRRPPTLNELLQ